MSALPAAATSGGINKVHPWCTEEKLPFNAHPEFTIDTRASQSTALLPFAGCSLPGHSRALGSIHPLPSTLLALHVL